MRIHAVLMAIMAGTAQAASSGPGWHETTFYEAYIEPIFWMGGTTLGIGVFGALLLSPFYYQYKKRKVELNQPDYRFRDYFKWLFEGILGDITRMVLIIAGIAICIALCVALVWGTNAAIDAMTVKGLLIFIAIMLVILVVK